MSKNFHADFLKIQNNLYLPCKMIISQYSEETESKDYGACNFKMNDRFIKYRSGKITPTKTGQFVTLWKRNGTGPILPYDISDSFDLVVINVRYQERFGQFIFPKNVLCEKGIISKEGKGGKRAMRIYPSWDITNNQQAKKTQAWQLLYFFEYDFNSPIDVARIQKLFSN